MRAVMNHDVEPKCEILAKLGEHLAVRRLHRGTNSLLATIISRLADEDAKVIVSIAALAISRMQRVWHALRIASSKSKVATKRPARQRGSTTSRLLLCSAGVLAQVRGLSLLLQATPCSSGGYWATKQVEEDSTSEDEDGSDDDAASDYSDSSTETDDAGSGGEEEELVLDAAGTTVARPVGCAQRKVPSLADEKLSLLLEDWEF